MILLILIPGIFTRIVCVFISKPRTSWLTSEPSTSVETKLEPDSVQHSLASWYDPKLLKKMLLTTLPLPSLHTFLRSLCHLHTSHNKKNPPHPRLSQVLLRYGEQFCNISSDRYSSTTFTSLSFPLLPLTPWHSFACMTMRMPYRGRHQSLASSRRSPSKRQTVNELPHYIRKYTCFIPSNVCSSKCIFRVHFR